MSTHNFTYLYWKQFHRSMLLTQNPFHHIYAPIGREHFQFRDKTTPATTNHTSGAELKTNIKPARVVLNSRAPSDLRARFHLISAAFDKTQLITGALTAA